MDQVVFAVIDWIWCLSLDVKVGEIGLRCAE